MAIDDDDEGFGDFIFAPPPPLNLNTFVRPESSGIAASMAPNFVQDDDWGDFINSSGAGGFSHAASALPIPSDPFGIPVAGKKDGVTKKKPLETKPSGAFPLSLFGEMEEAAGEESGAGLKNSDPVNKNAAVNIDVNDLIADLYKPNGDSKRNGSAREGRNGVVSNPVGLDSSWSWGHTSGFGNGLIANGTNEVKSESRGHDLDFDPLNLVSNGSNLNGNMSGSVLQGSNLNSGSNVVNGNEGFDDEEDDDGWEFKAAESKVEEIAKQPEQMKNQNGLTFNPVELNSSWNGANMDFSGWNTSANGVEQRSTSMNDGSVGERDSDTWGYAVAGSNGTPVDKIKKSDKTTDDVSKANFDSSSLSWDVVQHPDSNGLTSSLSGLNSNVVQADPGFLDANDEFSDMDGWAFKKAESDLQDTQVKTESDLKIQSNAADSNISNLDGPGVNMDLFAADWDTREGSSDMTQSNHNLSTETKDPDGDDDWEFKIAESESGPIDSSSKAKALTHSRSTGALPLSLFGDEEKDANDLAFHDVSLAQISALRTRDHNRSLGSSLSINDLISSLYNEVEQTAPASHLQNQDENRRGFSENALASTASNATEVLDDYSWEFKDASSIPVEEQTSITQDSTVWSSNIELPDWVDLFTKLKEELCLIAYEHLENIKRARETAALTGEDSDLSGLDREIQDLHGELSEYSNIGEEVHSEDHLPSDVRLSQLFGVLQQPKFQAINSEYQLLEKLLLVQNDSNSTVQLLKKVFSVLKILILVSRQEQASYVSAWSKMLSLCAEELRHGSMIWKQLLQENIQDQVLSRIEGKRYILALGEIYRLVEVLRCTARLYRPWILLMGPADSARFNTMMNESSTMWSSSGLEEALLSISDGSTVLDSIAYLRNLEDATLYEIVFSGQGPICQLSALNQGVVPGMDLVAWNGAHYFVKLANLWTNLTGSDPPSLPHLHLDDDV